MARLLLYLDSAMDLFEVRVMNLTNKMSWGLAAGIAALLLAGPAVTPVRAQVTIRFGRGDHRLEGQRFTTMRALAHRLDEAAQTAAREAGDTPEERSGRMRQRFLWAINDFARQARSFHERMDQYGASPWDVADEVDALTQRARQVSSQLRGANAFPETYEDWAQVVSTLTLMNRSLSGENVVLPPLNRRGYQPFNEDSRYRDGRHIEGFRGADGYVTGPPLREFRRLAGSLMDETDRALAAAERNRPDNRDRSLWELRRFSRLASELNRTSATGALDAREVGPLVNDLLEDARQHERSEEWAPFIRILEQMAPIVRYQ